VTREESRREGNGAASDADGESQGSAYFLACYLGCSPRLCASKTLASRCTSPRPDSDPSGGTGGTPGGCWVFCHESFRDSPRRRLPSR